MTEVTTEQRNAKVLAVLKSTKAPLGPTEIARRINEPWCRVSGGYFKSSVIVPILRRIGAVGVSGQYVSPKHE